MNASLFMVMAGGEAMNISAYLAILALTAMVVFYALEERSKLAPLGFAAAALVAAPSLFVLGRWPFGVVAVLFAVAALYRYIGRRRERHP
jgi:hypothetical protein